jgi:hypothetical protein
MVIIKTELQNRIRLYPEVMIRMRYRTNPKNPTPRKNKVLTSLLKIVDFLQNGLSFKEHLCRHPLKKLTFKVLFGKPILKSALVPIWSNFKFIIRIRGFGISMRVFLAQKLRDFAS